jgi:small subunit ribosomal protein S6
MNGGDSKPVEHKRKVYETTVIVNPTLEEHQVEGIIKNIEELIAKNAGTVKSTERWGRKRLSYPINKRNNGYYAHFEFEAEGDIVIDLERNLEYDENVMRYLTVRLDPKVQQAKEKAKLKPKDAAEEQVDGTRDQAAKEKNDAAEAVPSSKDEPDKT